MSNITSISCLVWFFVFKRWVNCKIGLHGIPKIAVWVYLFFHSRGQLQNWKFLVDLVPVISQKVQIWSLWYLKSAVWFLLIKPVNTKYQIYIKISILDRSCKWKTWIQTTFFGIQYWPILQFTLKRFQITNEKKNEK